MPVHIETNDIRVFKAVWDENGFKRAADKLFVTQSAVSQTIANLEDKLETKLFERNPLKLTETGIRLLNYAESVLAEEETVLDDIRNIRHGILATLSVALSGTVAELHGDDLLKAYIDTSPLTRVKLNVMPSRQIITAVSSDLWELGFGPFQQNMPDVFETLPLFTDERILMIAAEHPSLTAVREGNLTDVPLIVSHLDDPDLRPAIDKLRNNFGSIWEISDLRLRLSMIRTGRGMSYLDSKLVAAMPELVPVDNVAFARIPLTFGLFHRKRKQLSTGARQFIDVCQSHFANR